MLKTLATKLASVGYETRREELLAVAGALAAPNGHMRAILLEGSPGCGKTFLAESLAAALGSECIYHMMHSWTDDQELFMGIDVAAAVAGDATAVRQMGVLAQAALKSKAANPQQPIIVCLDEVDKVPDRTEMLLLDWLQTGRVPVEPGKHLETSRANILVIMTSNGTRPLSDAILRRVRRVKMTPLAVERVERLISEQAPCSQGLARLVYKSLREIASLDGAVVSLQEAIYCARELLSVCESHTDVALTLKGWGARGDSGSNCPSLGRHAQAIWAMVKASRGK